MSVTSITSNYLDRVLKFKANKEFHGDYLDEIEREKLLKQLFLALDFNEGLWESGKISAKLAFLSAVIIKNDSNLKEISPVTWKNWIEQYLNKAIALDPFNSQYLEKYVLDYKQICTLNKDFEQRYIRLFHPNSSEYQNLLVDLDIKPESDSFDYLDDLVTHPFISEMVFINKNVDVSSNHNMNQTEVLKEIARQGGIDNKILEEIENELPDHIKTIKVIFTYHPKTWDEALKANLSLKIALDIAPYNKEILELAICYYGHFYGRIIMECSNIIQNKTGKKKFFSSTFNTENPSLGVKINSTTEAVEKAKLLLARYKEIIISENNKDTNDDDQWISELYPLSEYNGFIQRIEPDLDKESVPFLLESLLETETLINPILIEHFKLKSSNRKLGFIIGPVIILGFGYLAYFVFPFLFGVILPVFLSILAVFGVLQLRIMWWKKKVFKIIS